MTKKIMLLCSSLVALVAVFAVSAQAEPEGMFYHEGNAIEGSVNESFSGPIGFSSALGGVECQTHAGVTVETNGGTLDSFEITTNTCRYTGAFAECTLVSHEFHGPATLTPTSANDDFDIEGFELTKTLVGPNCPVNGVPLTITAETLTAEPNNPSAISIVQISGESIIDPFGLEIELSGEMEAAGPETLGVTP